MPRKLIILSFFPLLILLIVFFLFNTRSTFSAATEHILISEIQIEGIESNDEFIELYNPTESAVDISSWSIQRETTSGTFAKKNFVEGNSVPAHGFFLIAHSSYTGIPITPDMTHASFTLSSGGATVFLVNNQTVLTTGDETTIIDKVAIGESALDPESSPFSAIPLDGQSIERKPGDANPSAGNGIDTNNNSEDFLLRAISEPQNTSSTLEFPTPTVSPTPSISPTESPIPSPTETPTPTQTLTPTPTDQPTPTPTETVSPTPTNLPTPTITIQPTPTQTLTPTPTDQPTPTIKPLPTLIPTPTIMTKDIGNLSFPGKTTSCSLRFAPIQIGFLKIFFPYISCTNTIFDNGLPGFEFN